VGIRPREGRLGSSKKGPFVREAQTSLLRARRGFAKTRVPRRRPAGGSGTRGLGFLPAGSNRTSPPVPRPETGTPTPPGRSRPPGWPVRISPRGKSKTGARPKPVPGSSRNSLSRLLRANRRGRNAPPPLFHRPGRASDHVKSRNAG
jgi:hypothetical protein